MRAISEAIEDAAAFTDFRDRVLRADQHIVPTAEQETARLPGENRAEHRARLKRQRREAKRVKVST